MGTKLTQRQSRYRARMDPRLVTLRGTHRPAPPGAARTGAPDPNEKVELTIVLRRRKGLPAEEAANVHVSREDFAKEFGADPADVQKVEAFAKEHHLAVEKVELGRRSVVLSGTLANAQKAFSAEVHCYRKGDQTFRARTGELKIPSDLQDVIQGIFGFDQRPQASTKFRRRPAIRPLAASDTSYTPIQVAQAYEYPTNLDGTGQTVALIELGGGYKTTDLKKYFKSLGLSKTPKVTAVSVDGAKNEPVGDPNSADGEVLLDIEIAAAIAPGAAFAVYFAPNTTQGFLDAITTAVHDTKHAPGVISISWGGPEDTWTGQAFTTYDQAFQDAATLGVTICVASGDSGSGDGETDGNAHVDFPASSPNVLACGGSSLQVSAGQIRSETVWNDGADGGASGGGVSEQFPLPDYQESANVPISVNASKFAGRGVPDVAGDADPATGYQTLVDGQQIVVGGTSAVAPLWAALIALVNQSLGKNVGFVNPVLYGSQNQSAFRDITSGNNGAYQAAVGWDACTGWGSPIGPGILQLFDGAAIEGKPKRHKHVKPPAS